MAGGVLLYDGFMKRVYLADAQTEERSALRLMLLDLDMQVVGEAADGLEALAALERQPYDVVFMDINMPRMDGLAATRRLHETLPADERRAAIVDAVLPLLVSHGERVTTRQIAEAAFALGKPVLCESTIRAVSAFHRSSPARSCTAMQPILPAPPRTMIFIDALLSEIQFQVTGFRVQAPKIRQKKKGQAFSVGLSLFNFKFSYCLNVFQVYIGIGIVAYAAIRFVIGIFPF